MTSAPNYRLSVATATHKGDRDFQQDKVEVLQHPYNKHCILVVVADGMGGRSGGAMAASQVMESARELLKQFDVEKDDPRAMLCQIVTDAHAVIHMLKVSSELDPHSTIAAHIIMPNGACHWIHCGDSRLYHFRKGRLVSRTRDHSYVQELIDQGKISEEQAAGHEQSNMITGCLGMDSDPPMVLDSIAQLQVGDVVLSCTDGLWPYFHDTELAKIAAALTPADACKQLLDLARLRAAGGGDNVSLAIVKISAKSNPEAKQEEAKYSLLDFQW
ncbi:MAG: protein phosphatase 2C domain-containing protein [Brachymonas sp.]|nr:protein phosphatase 2C domain-containing protein [Brachymonas sp.]